MMTEFSWPLVLDDLTRAPFRERLTASPDECVALARRLDILGVSALRAEMKVIRKNSRVYVTGRFEAEVNQMCVLSLEPFDDNITGEVEEEFFLTDDPGSIEVEVDEHSAEPWTADTLDLGEIVVQNLLLILDPYPRASDATLSDLDYEPAAEDEASGPVAALSQLKLNR
jgi:uncharacterized metal-binding protein YceD (DUF177 family)